MVQIQQKAVRTYDASDNCNCGCSFNTCVVCIPKSKEDENKSSHVYVLGASLMWLVDAVVEYLDAGPAFFEATAQAMLNDSFLGLSAFWLFLNCKGVTDF